MIGEISSARAEKFRRMITLSYSKERPSRKPRSRHVHRFRVPRLEYFRHSWRSVVQWYKDNWRLVFQVAGSTTNVRYERAYEDYDALLPVYLVEHSNSRPSLLTYLLTWNSWLSIIDISILGAHLTIFLYDGRARFTFGTPGDNSNARLAFGKPKS